MKAEHRKELQTNILADRVGRIVAGIRSPRQTPVGVWVIAGLVVAVVVGWYFATGTSKANSQLWVQVDIDTFNKDVNAAEASFQELARKNPRTIPGRTARFQRARLLLPQGMQDVLSEHRRDGAVKNLNEVKALYEALVFESSDVPLLAQEALMGAAQAEETLLAATKDDGQPAGSLDAALKLYRRLADKYPDSFLGQKAAAHVKHLEEHRGDVEKFYAELRRQAASKPTQDKN